MEKRKLLLVAVSVGVFLVIVLSAAILIIPPNMGEAAAARAAPIGENTAGLLRNPRGPASADAADMIRNNGDLQGLLIPPPGAASASGGDPAGSPVSASAVQENTFYINGRNSAQSSTVEREDPSRVVINVPQPSAPGVPAAASRPAAPPADSDRTAARQNTAAPAAQRAPAAGSSSPASSSGTAAPAKPEAPPSGGRTASGNRTAPSTAAPKPAAPAASSSPPARSAPAAARTAAARSTTAARSQKDYWIQTGAFSALVRAEDAKEILASKGLSSIIDDGEVNGRTWYRVRVGPYTSENEADYWLALVRAINGFDQSQIRSTQR